LQRGVISILRLQVNIAKTGILANSSLPSYMESLGTARQFRIRFLSRFHGHFSDRRSSASCQSPFRGSLTEI
jgi:hypothetical protein